MTALDGYGAIALLVIGAVFYFVRKIPAYLALNASVLVGFVIATARIVDFGEPADWVVMTVGLMLTIFGLLIVRVMLIRSVSLNLLATLRGETRESFGEDIGARLGDMRKFRLIRTQGEQSSLSPFGRFVARIVAVFYAIFRIET